MPTNNKKSRNKNSASRGNSRKPNSRRSRRGQNNGQAGYQLIKRNPTALNHMGCFRTQTMFSATVLVAATATVLRVDIIPTLNLFRL
jgi:hypothetical protein